MIFIGIISERQTFETLNKNIMKNVNNNELTLININNNSINNLKNVKFDTIILVEEIECLKTRQSIFKDMSQNLSYLIVNSDIKIKNNISLNIETNVITYGGNCKSTITFSSITDEMMLISVQRNFKNKSGNMIEVGEYSYKKDKNDIHEVLIEFIIRMLYNTF